MKKLILILFITFFICGCWNYRELNSYSIITGIAIDKTDKSDEIEVSVLISNLAKQGSENNRSAQASTVVYTGTGDSVFSAIKDISLISPKELYMGHFLILVVSEDIARSGIYNITDFFLREPSARKDFNVIISKDCKAKDTLKIINPLSNFPSQSIYDNLKYSNELQGIINNVTFNELISNLVTTGIEPTVNSITVEGDKEKGSSKENTEESEPEAYVKLGSLGIFKDDKLVDWASYHESLGINIINNNINELFYKINYNDGYVIVNSTSFSSDVSVKVKNNKPVININVSGDTKIKETSGNINLNDDVTLNDIRKKANNAVEKDIKKAINLAIENKTDIFGFGLKIKQKYPKFYENNKNEIENNLSNMTFNIKSDLIIKSKGSAQNSMEEIND